MGKHIIQKGVDAQTLPAVTTPDSAINMENLRWGSTSERGVGKLESIKATLLRSAVESPLFPDGANYCVGSRGDDALGILVYACYNSEGDHGIYLYSVEKQKNYKVVQGSFLNFTRYSLVHSMAIIGGVLYWTHDEDEPRRVNLGAAMAVYGYSDAPLSSDWTFSADDPFEYNLIRRPVNLPPSIQKKTDSSTAINQIANESFRFAVQLVYWDGEVTVLSPFSTASKLNFVTDTYNYITVGVSTGFTVPASARKVRVVAEVTSRAGVLEYYVVKEWDKAKSAEAAEISEHNLGTGQLTYDFYNNLYGEPVDSTTAGLAYHYIPRRASTLEVIKNRLFLGNLLDGYDTPATTSLSLATSTVVSPGASGFDKTLILVRLKELGFFGSPDFWYYKAYWVHIPEAIAGLQPGYYELSSTKVEDRGVVAEPADPAAPATVAVTDLTFLNQDWWTARRDVQPVDLRGAGDGHEFTDYTTWAAGTVTITGSATETISSFKSLSQYQAGMVFYDRGMRRCGVVTSRGLVVTIPPRDFEFSQGVGALLWSLSNAQAEAEIPDWAYYYAPVLTKNLRTRSFLQGFDRDTRYATRNAAGEYEFTTTTFSSLVVAVAIDTTALLQANLGYSFTEGDVAVLVTESSQTHQLPVLGVSGKYILLSPKDLGALVSGSTPQKFIYEIYTPYKNTTQEPFYEVGQVFEVSNPGEATRSYSVTSGYIGPDSFALTRNYLSTTYFAEAMCPNDKFWRRWDSDHGRINLVTDLGEKRLKTAVRFSSTYVEGSAVNGLSEFLPANEEILPENVGALRRLLSTAKVQREGGVLLAIGEKETLSLYIGEAMLSDQSGSQVLVKSTGVIGAINILQGSLGTIHPESCAVLEGRAFWLDMSRGKVASYASNGLFPISNYRLERVVELLKRAYEATDAATIEAYGSRPYFPGGVDPYHGEYLLTVPRLTAEVPRGTIEELELDYPYDLWDGKGKTWVFKIERDQWQGAQRFEAEYFATVGNKLFSFSPIELEAVQKEAFPHEHGAGEGYSSFYGQAVACMVAVVENGEPDARPKVFTTLALAASRPPDYTHLLTEEPNVQSTDLVAGEWTDNEGVYYAEVPYDRLSPNAAGTGDERRLRGDELRGPYLLVLLKWEGSALLHVQELNVGFSYSSGHTV